MMNWYYPKIVVYNLPLNLTLLTIKRFNMVVLS